MNNLLTQFVVQDDSSDSQSFPALQANCYQPSSMKQEISLCLSDESMGKLDPDSIKALGIKLSTAEFGDSEVNVGLLPSDVRWVVLAAPKLFCTDKSTNEVFRLERGVSLRDTGRVTISRVLLAAVDADEKLLLDASGAVQIFTLNLKSSKSALIGSMREPDAGVARNNGHRTICSLNKAMREHYKQPRAWLVHLASVELKAIPEMFKSRVSGESSKGIRFVLGDGNAKVLSEEQQKKIFDLVSSEDFKELAADPFRLSAKKSEEIKAEVTIEYPKDDEKTGTWEGQEDVSALPF